MERLTKEQAIAISATTGQCFCSMELMIEEIEKRLGEPLNREDLVPMLEAGKMFELFEDDLIAMKYEEPTEWGKELLKHIEHAVNYTFGEDEHVSSLGGPDKGIMKMEDHEKETND